jgi:DnaJ-domain-containing protein 1
MNISARLIRLLKTVANDKMDQFVRIFEQEGSNLDEILEEWEKEHGLNNDSFNPKNGFDHTDSQSYREKTNPTKPSAYPQQVVEDLHLFGLKPPISFEQVKKARNQEIKKFHPDKFLSDPEKMETAKQIVQIYNAAYDRLEKSLK